MRKYLLYCFSIVCLLLLLAGILTFVPLASAPLVGVKGDYAITGVRVVDTVTGLVSGEVTVSTRGGRILDIAAGKPDEAPSGFTEIQASGKFLIPGLWDMHTHSLKLSPQLHHPLFIRYGITSVRDMSGCMSERDSYWACPQDRRRWQRQALAGERVSPRYPLQSSYQTNGGNEVPAGFPEYFRIATEDDARALVSFYLTQGVDFIKTYSELSEVQYDYLIRHTSQNDIEIAGHKPFAVPLTQALNSGMRSIEHGRLFAFECYRYIDAFRKLEDPILHYNAAFMRELLNSQDREKCADLMDAMSLTPTWWVPTLTTLKMSAKAEDPIFRDDVRLKTIPYIVQKLLWEPDINRAATKGYDSRGKFVHEDFYALVEGQVALAQAAGVGLLSGTDNIDTFVFTGASLHDELNYLVAAGLTPFEALQTATILPAEFANLDHELGSVQVGKQADLVLLNSNPLLEIGNTRDISGVFLGDQYFSEQALAALDDYALDMAQSLRINLRYLADLLFSPLMRKQLAD